MTAALPVVAVGAIVFDATGAVLLVQRAKPPGKGLWTVPGGRVEAGESLTAACARELLEETGLVAVVGELVTVVDRISRCASGALEYHYVIADFLVTSYTGTLAPGSDAASVRFATRTELAELEGAGQLTHGLIAVIDKAQNM